MGNMISTDVQDVRVGCRFDAVSRETFEGMSKMQRTEIEVRLATLVM